MRSPPPVPASARVLYIEAYPRGGTIKHMHYTGPRNVFLHLDKYFLPMDFIGSGVYSSIIRYDRFMSHAALKGVMCQLIL